MKISAVYKITNTVTNDFYIGSSKNVKQRWTFHKCSSSWNEQPNNPMYLDMQKYGVDKFEFEVLEVVEIEKLKEMEQQFIELLKPTYNRCNAKGLNIERCKEYNKEHQKEYDSQLCFYNGETLTLSALRGRLGRRGIPHPQIEAKKYLLNKPTDKFKEYQQSDEYKEYQKEFYKEYNNQLCCYNGEVLTLCALSKRFQRAGIEHPQIEAKKYLLNKSKDK